MCCNGIDSMMARSETTTQKRMERMSRDSAAIHQDADPTGAARVASEVDARTGVRDVRHDHYVTMITRTMVT